VAKRDGEHNAASKAHQETIVRSAGQFVLRQAVAEDGRDHGPRHTLSPQSRLPSQKKTLQWHYQNKHEADANVGVDGLVAGGIAACYRAGVCVEKHHSGNGRKGKVRKRGK